ncbi:putative YigZ family protein [Nonlabens xylanidelens]|uniref:Putative YigZ family protein n=1 Tax=Nonlabens xylanidelens TaxID=191564 RepID=A0A2S6IL90_9FLAO|nr:YigZ family protein [Nonlabens xylanidelens]PPK94979.1 putative YigZ family protein [Nonlabens xylanidelens]PQJ17522.1 YigZ family protein [Nonlabens xylanidelens]
MADSYKTITKPTTEILYKDRGSKFYGYAFPITSDEEVNDLIAPLRNRHPKAGHHCYAWKLGADDNNYRANDDGEPSHSAGDPILGQINSYELSDVLVVVSRIFGGTKLGVGGLISAYREAAKISLETAQIKVRTITASIEIKFEYPQMSQVMRFIDENNFKIGKQELTASCVINIDVPASRQEAVTAQINKMYPIKAKTIE